MRKSNAMWGDSQRSLGRERDGHIVLLMETEAKDLKRSMQF